MSSAILSAGTTADVVSMAEQVVKVVVTLAVKVAEGTPEERVRDLDLASAVFHFRVVSVLQIIQLSS